MTMVAEFIFLGTQNTGSWSLASTKTTLFALALSGTMENIAETFNRYLIPRLMALNGIEADDYPKIVYGDIEGQPLEEIGTFINQLVQAGALTPDDALERKLRELAKLPQKPERDETTPEPAPAPAPKPAPAKPNGSQPGGDQLPKTPQPTPNGA